MQQKHLLLIIFLSYLPLCALANEDNPAAAATNAKLGVAYLKKGLYAASKDRLLDAVHYDPDIAVTWYSMAYYLEKTNQPAEAEKDYRKAISLEPKSGAAKNDYGTFLCRQKRYKEGIAQFIEAVHQPAYLDAAKAYENAGICALMMHDNTLALQYFRQAIDNNPNLPFSLINAARLSYQSGNKDEAVKYFADFKLLVMGGQPDAVIQRYHDYVFTNPAAHPHHPQQHVVHAELTLPMPT